MTSTLHPRWYTDCPKCGKQFGAWSHDELVDLVVGHVQYKHPVYFLTGDCTEDLGKAFGVGERIALRHMPPSKKESVNG